MGREGEVKDVEATGRDSPPEAMVRLIFESKQQRGGDR